MVTSHTIAQATQAPNNGASNAEDFQPPTRNPQTAPGSLQPGAGTQETTGQDVLSNPNARLSVPSGTPAEARTVAKPSAGINLAFILVISAVLVILAEWWFRRRDRHKTTPVISQISEFTTDAQTQPEIPQSKGSITPKPATTEVSPKKPKKSKSKRKKK